MGKGLGQRKRALGETLKNKIPGMCQELQRTKKDAVAKASRCRVGGMGKG